MLLVPLLNTSVVSYLFSKYYSDGILAIRFEVGKCVIVVVWF